MKKPARHATRSLGYVAIFSVLLGKVPTEVLGYQPFAFAAMVPWQVFFRAMLGGSMSPPSNWSLIAKVYCSCNLMPAATSILP